MAIATNPTTTAIEIPNQIDGYLSEIEALMLAKSGVERLIAETSDQNVLAILKDNIHRFRGRIDLIQSRILPILRAGYAQFTPPQNWVEGYAVKDPRPYKGWIISDKLVMSFFVTCLAGILAIPLFGSGFALFTLLVFLVVSCCACAYRTYLQGENRKALTQAGLPISGTLYFLKTALPVHTQAVLDKAKASGLFTRVSIIAPREAFEKVNVPLDPYIIGIAAGENFLIAAFNLGEDLQHLP